MLVFGRVVVHDQVNPALYLVECSGCGRASLYPFGKAPDFCPRCRALWPYVLQMGVG